MTEDSLDRFSVKGQTAIVTGASSGIGRAIAEQFAADGADMVICSREQGNVDPVAERINAGVSFMANFDDISPNGWETVVNMASVAGETIRAAGVPQIEETSQL